MIDAGYELHFVEELELRAASGQSKGPGTLAGYAVRWNTPSGPLRAKTGEGDPAIKNKGAFREQFSLGAFAESIGEREVLAVVAHDEDYPYGRLSTGTLRLFEDGLGLRYENDLPDNTAGRDLAVSVARGDLKSVSIAFLPKPGGEAWKFEGEVPLRTISKASIAHIAYVSRPAHRDTSIALRSLAAAQAEALVVPAPEPEPEPTPTPIATPESQPSHAPSHAEARLRLVEADL